MINFLVHIINMSSLPYTCMNTDPSFIIQTFLTMKVAIEQTFQIIQPVASMCWATCCWQLAMASVAAVPNAVAAVTWTITDEDITVPLLIAGVVVRSYMHWLFGLGQRPKYIAKHKRLAYRATNKANMVARQVSNALTRMDKTTPAIIQRLRTSIRQVNVQRDVRGAIIRTARPGLTVVTNTITEAVQVMNKANSRARKISKN